MCVMTETDAVVPSLGIRSASDDQLLSHASITRDSSTSSLRLDSEDIKNLTKSDDIDTKQHPACNHDVPEKCVSSCWSFNDDRQQCLMADDSAGEINRCLYVTEQFPVMVNKSGEECCQHRDVTDEPDFYQSPETHAACFCPTSW